MSTIDFAAIAPELTLVVTLAIVLTADLFLPTAAKGLLNSLSMVGAAVALVFTINLWDAPRETLAGAFAVNNYAVAFKVVFLVSLLAILGISLQYFRDGRYFQGEYYMLLLACFVGMLVMPSSRDLITLFVALETVSVPAFVLAGMKKRDVYSSEAAMKFFLIGVLSVAIMLFGMSLVYGVTGSTSFDVIAIRLAAGQQPALVLAGVSMVMVGFAFKVSAVPFHFWAPDTYAGAPIPVTAMLAVASKAAGFAGLIAVTFIAFRPLADIWAPALGIIAILTMTLGNLAALQQRDIVRLLAYSSVAQAGYMLIPFGLGTAAGSPGSLAIDVNDAAVQAIIFYLAAYAVMNIGAFGVIIGVARTSGARSIRDYAGLGSRSPLMAMAMTTFLLSLGGAPPTVGLWAKFSIIQAAAQAGTFFAYVLLGFLVINSVIAFFYYLRVIKTMWMDEAPDGAALIVPGFNLASVVSLLAFATILLGILPGIISGATSVVQLAQ